MAVKESTILLMNAYLKLSQSDNQWEGRDTNFGQTLLSRMRDEIAQEIGEPQQTVQDCIRLLCIQPAFKLL